MVKVVSYSSAGLQCGPKISLAMTVGRVVASTYSTMTGIFSSETEKFHFTFLKKKQKNIYILPAVRANNRYLSATSWQTWFASCKTALSTWVSLNQLLTLNTNCNDFTTVEQQRGNDMIAFHWMRPELRKSHNIFIMPRWKIFLFYP